MILPDFILTSRQDKLWTESGFDSLKNCFNKDYFKSYPYTVEYNYNSRGYRDAEWPKTIDELKHCIWCVGDSFTVGLGSPLAHTWVNILQQRTGVRCINVSMDGASNEWIVRKINRIIEEINPQQLVVQWSYLHRGEKTDFSLSDERRRMGYALGNMTPLEQLMHFTNLQASIKNSTTQIVQSVIPRGIPVLTHDQYKEIINRLKGANWPDLLDITIDQFDSIDTAVKKELENFEVFDAIINYLESKESSSQFSGPLYNVEQSCILVDQIDFARDSHHYDHLTAGKFVDSVINRFNIASS
jgi:hypothetical protein